MNIKRFSILMILFWVGVLMSFSFFFGGMFIDILLNTQYIKAYCNVTNVDIVPRTCCWEQCSICDIAPVGSPLCSSLLTSLTPGICGNGYRCCQECCSTCQSCYGSGDTRVCSSYSCACYCCSSTPDLLCEIQCSTCYTGYVHVSFHDDNGTTYESNIHHDCGLDYNCVLNYVSNYEVGTEYLCYYSRLNPENVWDPLGMESSYKIWAMVLFGIGVLMSFITGIVLCFCKKLYS